MEHFWYYFLLNLVNVWGYHNNYFLKYFLFKKLIREYHSVLKLKLKKKKESKNQATVSCMIYLGINLYHDLSEIIIIKARKW